MTLLKSIGKNCCVLLSLIVCLFTFHSCQKTDSGVTGPSAGTLKSDSTFDCLPALINGTYFKDSVLRADNFIDLNIYITRAGTYSIESNSVNGYSFKGAGTLGIPGDNKVRLHASGKPVVAGTDQFLFRYGTSYCLFDIEVKQAEADAQYSLAGAGGTRAGAILNGTYVTGQQMNDMNTVTAALQITSTGNYLIATTELNGITFSSEGVFTDLAQASVVLTAQGTPLSAGTFNYPLIGNGTSCAFSVTFL